MRLRQTVVAACADGGAAVTAEGDAWVREEEAALETDAVVRHG
jgi:hypothetical protein